VKRSFILETLDSVEETRSIKSKFKVVIKKEKKKGSNKNNNNREVEEKYLILTPKNWFKILYLALDFGTSV
jgi:hypothetical protein